MLNLILSALLLAVHLGPPGADIPDWCKKLPRPEYKTLKRFSPSDSWLEVYEVRPGVFAIYEPQQSEEVISCLITGSTRAIQFDTGLGIGDILLTARQLTRLPIIVLKWHTHNDRVGDNWQFNNVHDLDTAFTLREREGIEQGRSGRARARRSGRAGASVGRFASGPCGQGQAGYAKGARATNSTDSRSER
jgi:hypothetical protein